MAPGQSELTNRKLFVRDRENRKFSLHTGSFSFCTRETGSLFDRDKENQKFTIKEVLVIVCVCTEAFSFSGQEVGRTGWVEQPK